MPVHQNKHSKAWVMSAILQVWGLLNLPAPALERPGLQQPAVVVLELPGVAGMEDLSLCIMLWDCEVSWETLLQAGRERIAGIWGCMAAMLLLSGYLSLWCLYILSHSCWQSRALLFL